MSGLLSTEQLEEAWANSSGGWGKRMLRQHIDALTAEREHNADLAEQFDSMVASTTKIANALRRLADYVVVQPEYDFGSQDGAVDQAIGMLNARQSGLKALTAERDQLSRCVDEEISNRDGFEERLTALCYRIAPQEVIGEWSSLNQLDEAAGAAVDALTDERDRLLDERDRLRGIVQALEEELAVTAENEAYPRRWVLPIQEPPDEWQTYLQHSILATETIPGPRDNPAGDAE